jgi:hypothetical protein
VAITTAAAVAFPARLETRQYAAFWSIRSDRVAALRARGLAAWRAEALALNPCAAPIVEQIADLNQLAFTQYRDVRMRRWHGERIVFLGDAAHATSPQLGQGANLALWDAMCLADAMAAGHGDVTAALAAYTAARRRHLDYYQLATRALTPFVQGGRLAAARLGARRRVPGEPVARAAAPPDGAHHGRHRSRDRPAGRSRSTSCAGWRSRAANGRPRADDARRSGAEPADERVAEPGTRCVRDHGAAGPPCLARIPPS